MGCCGSKYGSRVEKFYTFDSNSVIGEGSYSCVYRGVHKKTEEEVAVKLIPKNLCSSRSVWENEIAMMQQCGKHHNIVSIREVFESDKYIHIVMDLAKGGGLFDVLIRDGAYSESETRKHIRDILEALKFLHSQGIIHRLFAKFNHIFAYSHDRDLKPENLLLSSDQRDASIRIADFSMASVLNNEKFIAAPGGTWAYCAPECINLDATKQLELKFTSKSDIWSVGILLYVLLSATHPFDVNGQETKTKIKQNIKKGIFSFDSSAWETISTEAKNLIKDLLSLDPASRPTAEEALETHWFQKESLTSIPLSNSGNFSEYTLKMKRKLRASMIAAVALQTIKRNSKTAGSMQKDDTPQQNSDKQTELCVDTEIDVPEVELEIEMPINTK